MVRPSPQPAREPSTGLRRTVEQRSGPVLVLLSRQPKLLIPVLSLALLIAGLAVDGLVGTLCLGALLLLVGWLSYLSWPVVVGPARAVRLATLGMLAAVLALRLL